MIVVFGETRHSEEGLHHTAQSASRVAPLPKLLCCRATPRPSVCIGSHCGRFPRHQCISLSSTPLHLVPKVVSQQAQGEHRTLVGKTQRNALLQSHPRHFIKPPHITVQGRVRGIYGISHLPRRRKLHFTAQTAPPLLLAIVFLAQTFGIFSAKVHIIQVLGGILPCPLPSATLVSPTMRQLNSRLRGLQIFSIARGVVHHGSGQFLRLLLMHQTHLGALRCCLPTPKGRSLPALPRTLLSAAIVITIAIDHTIGKIIVRSRKTPLGS